MKRKIAIALTLNIFVAVSATAGEVYRWTNPGTGEVLVTPTPPPYPIKEKRVVGSLPNGDMVELILDSNAPEVKVLIEKRKAQEAEQRRIAEEKAREQAAREVEQRRIAEEKQKQQAVIEREQEQAHPLLLPKESNELQRWLRIETSLPKDVQERRMAERRKLAEEKAKTDPEEIKKNAQINSLKTGEGFKIGMNEVDLIALWGEPTKINTSIRSTGVSKQIIYTDPCKLLGLGKECMYKSRIIYSENGVITSLQY